MKKFVISLVSIILILTLATLGLIFIPTNNPNSPNSPGSEETTLIVKYNNGSIVPNGTEHIFTSKATYIFEINQEFTATVKVNTTDEKNNFTYYVNGTAKKFFDTEIINAFKLEFSQSVLTFSTDCKTVGDVLRAVHPNETITFDDTSKEFEETSAKVFSLVITATTNNETLSIYFGITAENPDELQIILPKELLF